MCVVCVIYTGLIVCAYVVETAYLVCSVYLASLVLLPSVHMVGTSNYVYIYTIPNLYKQKIRHYGPHIYSIAVFHVFRLFEVLTNIRRAHDVVIFMCLFITRIHVRIPIHVHKQQWL